MKRRLVRSATMYCKFSDTKDYVNETSIAQRNEVLGLELSSLMLLLLHSLSLKKTLLVNLKSLIMSLNWTTFFKDQESTPIIYQSCITWLVFILCNGYYSQIMLVVETKISNFIIAMILWLLLAQTFIYTLHFGDSVKH